MYFAQVETKVKKFSTGRRQIEKANFVGSLSLSLFLSLSLLLASLLSFLALSYTRTHTRRTNTRRTHTFTPFSLSSSQSLFFVSNLIYLPTMSILIRLNSLALSRVHAFHFPTCLSNSN